MPYCFPLLLLCLDAAVVHCTRIQRLSLQFASLHGQKQRYLVSCNNHLVEKLLAGRRGAFLPTVLGALQVRTERAASDRADVSTTST